MKKIYIAIALFIGISSLFAKDMKMIIHQQDGTTKEYLTEGVETMSFIKSDVPPILKIYHHIEALNAQYDVEDIDSLSFSDDNVELLIGYDGGKIKYLLDELDSLVFSPVERDEIKICDQVWMTKNLDVDHYRNGDPIPQAAGYGEWVNTTSGAWCYFENDPANGKIYGKLYNLAAVNDPRGLAPEGWHVATDEEWKELENCLKANDEYWCNNISEYIGKSLASNDLWKSSGKTCTIGNDLSANNATGFAARPGGYRNCNYGYFYQIGAAGHWWASTKSSSSFHTYRVLSYEFSNLIIMFSDNTKLGLSVRCVRD
jgi:uncharacterized protein (TIGR02145 family)